MLSGRGGHGTAVVIHGRRSHDPWQHCHSLRAGGDCMSGTPHAVLSAGLQLSFAGKNSAVPQRALLGAGCAECEPSPSYKKIRVLGQK